jgi:2-succinyl-6-hydroxy-2,4-cyclohexadiene-1-carboxylate synthase
MERLSDQRLGAPDGPAMMCLHGFLGRGADWSEFAVEWLARNPEWRVFLVDLPGHDGSPPCGVEELARRLVDFLDREAIPACALAGYSMGGRLALHAAVSFPERFPVYIGVSTTAGLEDREARRDADRRLAAQLRGCDEAGFREFLRGWWNLPVFDSPHKSPAALERFLASRAEHDPALLAECLELWSPGVLDSLWESLPEYPGRAFLAAGACDLKYVELAQRMASAFQNAEVAVLPDCGHRVLEECPRRLVLELRNWPSLLAALASRA